MRHVDLRRNRSRSLNLSAALISVVAGGLWAMPAFAGEPTEATEGSSIDSPDQDPLVANGSPVGTCAWPTAVAVTGGGGLCTGTLIHPELVVYAAHCGGGNKTVRFGESAFSGGRTADVAFCMTNPDYQGTADQAHDWAFCRLAEPVTDVPITPPVHGPCETTILNIGQEVAVVGFGQTLQNVTGEKNWGLTTIAAVNKVENVVVVGTSGTASVCPGDSGGPLYVRFPDNSWRAVGIASTVSGGCGGTGTHSLINGAIPWIEAESGVDITPCTTADGTWAPGPDCGGFNALDPNVGSGDWSSWCSGTPATGDADVCGPAWDQFDAELPPQVSITSPVWGDKFEANAAVDILIEASKDPDGPAIKEIRLKINTNEVATDDFDPWSFIGATFGSEGVYTLTAVAEDWSGNIVESDPVAIGIGNAEVPPEPEPEPEDTGDSADSADEVGEDTLGGDGGGGDASGCSTTSQPRSSWPLVLLLAIPALRRRRA